jgi:hypothetical protein
MTCFGWGCLAAVVLAGLGIGSCVAVVYRGGSAAHDVATAYLEAVEAGRFEEAFSVLGPEAGAARDVDGFVAFERANRAAFGDCSEWRLGGTSLNREAGRSAATVRYRADCATGPIEVAFVVEQIDGEWLIQDIRYREPNDPLPVATCAECGGVLPPGSRFCPLCGTAVAPTEGSEPTAPPAGASE